MPGFRTSGGNPKPRCEGCRHTHKRCKACRAASQAELLKREAAASGRFCKTCGRPLERREQERLLDYEKRRTCGYKCGQVYGGARKYPKGPDKSLEDLTVDSSATRERLKELRGLIATVKQTRHPGYEVYLEALARRKERLGETA